MATVAKLFAWAYAGFIVYKSPALLTVAIAIGIASGTHATMTAVQAVIAFVGRQRPHHD